MKIKLTAVNYLNTFPFKYGLEKHPNILKWAEIEYATPFECAKKLLNKTTQLALAPVAVLAYQPNLQMVTDYCLSTTDEVQTVKMYSDKSISETESVTLDYQSLSSVSLLKVLMKYFWKKEVRYVNGYKGFENHLQTDAMIVIGDRTFELNGRFKYEYDLASEWYRFFGKPFVFAAWISNVQLSNEQINDLNTAFQFGISHIDEVIEYAIQTTDVLNFLDAEKRKKVVTQYLKHNMQYNFTAERKESVKYFLKLLKYVLYEDIAIGSII